MNSQSRCPIAPTKSFSKIFSGSTVSLACLNLGRSMFSSRTIKYFALPLVVAILFVGSPNYLHASKSDDEKVVAALDSQYQEAVKKNDVATMSRILSDDFVLVTGKGQSQTKADLLKESGSGTITYEHQEDTNRTVRVWGDTAVVTALLWVKGSESGKSFDYKLWFSDVYVRTPSGWRYVFGQASLQLPKEH